MFSLVITQLYTAEKDRSPLNIYQQIKTNLFNLLHFRLNYVMVMSMGSIYYMYKNRRRFSVFLAEKSRKGLGLVVITLGMVTALTLLVWNSVEAAEKKFSDFDEEVSGFDEVMSLVDKGVVSGYEDGTFKPHKDITREQVALMLSDALKLEAPADLDKALSNYKDVNKDYWYAKEIAAVTEAGIFEGDDGSFLPKDSISRQQMASTIARAFALKATDSDVDLADLDKVSESHLSNVIALAQHEVVKGEPGKDGNFYFSAYKNLSRVQFSMMLDRAMHVNATIEGVSGNTVTISGYDYTVDGEASGILNEENADALKNAKVSFDSNGSKIARVKDLQLNSNGTSDEKVVLDGGNNKVFGDLTINADSVSVKNVTVEGNLIIAGDDVDADGITVKGDTIVGESSTAALSNVKTAADGQQVTFKNSTLGKLVINEKDANVTIEGTTKVAKLVVEQNAAITVEGNAEVSEITVTGDATEVELNGSAEVDTLVVESKDAKITLGSGVKVGNIALPEDTKVEDVIANYDDVKDQIDKVNGETPDESTPPVTPPPGDGGSDDKGIKDFEELNDALENADADDTITLSKNFEGTSDETIEITKPVTIEGNGATLKFSDAVNEKTTESNGISVKANNVTINDLNIVMSDTNGWEGLFAVQVYAKTGVTLKNFTGTNADAALLVNSSDVTLEGNIDVSGNEFGGIEVSQGENVSETPKLDISGATLVNESESFEKKLPTIWEDGVEESHTTWVTGVEDLNHYVYNENGKSQIHYYLSPIEAENVDLSLRSQDADPNRADDILTAPNGSYIASFKLTNGTKINQLGNLKLELMNGDQVLATNELKDQDDWSDGFNGENSNITVGFNIGQKVRYGASDWNHGEYTDTETTPNKLKVSYSLDGVSYVSGRI